MRGRVNLAINGSFWIGVAVVLAASLAAWRWAVDAECKPLEEIAPPLGSAGG